MTSGVSGSRETGMVQGGGRQDTGDLKLVACEPRCHWCHSLEDLSSVPSKRQADLHCTPIYLLRSGKPGAAPKPPDEDGFSPVAPVVC